MFDRQELNARRCVRTLSEIVLQVPDRWAARSTLPVNESTSGLILLWTFLRWERRFPLTLLEEMGIDIWAFTKDVDNLLKEKSASSASIALSNLNTTHQLHNAIIFWLDLSISEARTLGHDFLGVEHLFLALVAHADPAWSSVFKRNNIEYEQLKTNVLQAFESKQLQRSNETYNATEIWTIDETNPTDSAVSWAASWDRSPAVGITRRFSIAVLMMMVTLFAMIFSTLRWLNQEPIVYILCGVFVFNVALGQMFLFQGKFPRAASIWSGVVIFAVEIGIVVFVERAFNNVILDSLRAIFCMIVSIPVGAFFGYLAGGLTAGVVLILDLLNKEAPPEVE